MPDGYRIWVNEARTILIWMWESGKVEVATRNSPDQIWSIPVEMEEEK